jgi:hypothetical protein
LTHAASRDENKKRTILRRGLIVLTRRIDQALEALALCRERLPFLRDLYRPGSPERCALDAALEGVRRADHTLVRRCGPEGSSEKHGTHSSA